MAYRNAEGRLVEQSQDSIHVDHPHSPRLNESDLGRYDEEG